MACQHEMNVTLKEKIDKVETAGEKSSKYKCGKLDLHKVKDINIVCIIYCFKNVESQNNIGQRAQELWYTSENGFF